MWKRMWVFLIVLFFVLLSDAVLSDWVPGYLQDVLGSPLQMGIMMAVSSVVGLCMDVIFPKLLRQSGVRKLAGGAILGSLVFLLTMFSSTWWNYALILAIGMAAWGIYYELDSFMTQQYVVGVAASGERTSAWALVSVIRSLAYFIGPIVGGYVALFGDRTVVISAGCVLGVGYLLFLLLKHPSRQTHEMLDIHSINVTEEIRCWVQLGYRVWPILLVSFLGGLVDATFWTVGTVLTDSLAQQSWIGGWFLSAYLLPFLCVGLFVTRLGIREHKKRLAQFLLFLGGLALYGVAVSPSLPAMLLFVVLSGIFFAALWPLTDAVYTDLVARARKGRKHIIGMSAATYSIAYIIGPIAAGYIAGVKGEQATFGYIGIFVASIAILLLLSTPLKLKLPQEEMKTWE